MALRNIIEEGDPVLRKVCREVGEVSDRYKEMLDDMVDTMREANGVGLAAPQVGIMRRMFVAEPEPDELYYFVDPEIVELEGEQESNEGCLSVPGKIGTVIRPEKIRITGKNKEGEMQDLTFEGFAATVMCHEFDHLEGILYIDKADNIRSADEAYEEEE